MQDLQPGLGLILEGGSADDYILTKKKNSSTKYSDLEAILPPGQDSDMRKQRIRSPDMQSTNIDIFSRDPCRN